ncbi:SDR family NAD(P)-dependent oxidoreductase [Aliikangiella maris]|uniref:SDR family oxidoreductase n=2 Tax=Aliikangiella maris TaxID=3162458 RepID=A0ABV3MR35_9GAMM
MNRKKTSHYFRLDNQIALITGGGTGIGKSIAQQFAKAGATVIITGRTLSTITSVANEIGGHAIACDVSDYQQVVSLFTKIQQKFGRLDVLVNNAGQSGPIANIAHVDHEAWQKCVEVNLLGSMYCLQQAAQIMMQQEQGAIINMSSLMGLQGYPMRSAYCATKFGIIGMTQAVARELGPYGIRVNAICPGAVNGELMEKVVYQRAQAENRSVESIIKENYTDVSALKDWVEPEDIAQAALFLASDSSRSITAETIKVDCGRF